MGFTGTRDGMTNRQKETLRQVLAEYVPAEFHHGDCIGADAEAHAIVRKYCTPARVILHPPRDQRLRAFCLGDTQVPARGSLAQHHHIVRQCGMLVAAPETREEDAPSDTWATIRYAKLRNVSVVVLYP